MMMKVGEELNGGTERNRTAVRGVAVPCMTTLPPRLTNTTRGFISVSGKAGKYYLTKT